MYRKRSENPARPPERALGAGHTAALCCAKVRAALLRFVVRKCGGRFSTLLCESPEGTSPLCSAKVRRALLRFALRKSGRHTSPLCSAKVPCLTSPLCSGEVCAWGGGGQIPWCASGRPRPSRLLISDKFGGGGIGPFLAIERGFP